METASPEPDPNQVTVEATPPPVGDPVQAALAAGARVSVSALLKRLLLFLGVMAVAGTVATVWNGQHSGTIGRQLALLSTLCCGLSAGSALVLVGMTAGTPLAFTGTVGSILLRTLGPLAIGALWIVTHPEWPVENLIAVHVPLFLVSLTVETILVVDIVSTSSRSGTMLGKGRASRKMHG